MRSEEAARTKTLRILAHGLVLTLANLGGVVLGFVMFYRILVHERIPLQLGVAVGFTVLAFLAWSYLAGRLAPHLRLAGRDEFAWVYVVAPIWTVVVFVPVHYVFTGYITSPANIVMVCAFQLPTNALALWVAAAQRGRDRLGVEL